MLRKLQRGRRLLFPPTLTACVVVATLAASCVKLPRRTTPAVASRVSPVTKEGAEARPRVNLNTATAGELERLPGVGPALAARVVEHRARYGPFRRVEHLMAVRGISERRFRALRPHVTAD